MLVLRVVPRVVRWLTVAWALALLAAAPAMAATDRASCSKVVLSSDPDYPPLHWYDGLSLRGPSIALATRILSDLQIPYEVRYVGPWKRVLATAAQGQIDLVATLKIQPERERYLDFVRTPAFPNPVAVFVQRQKPFLFHSWPDLAGHRGGIALGNTFGQQFSAFAATRLQLEESGTADTNFRKLGLGRIDYFVVGLYTGETWLARNKAGAQFMALRPLLTDDKNYFGFASASPCRIHLAAFEARLKQLVAQQVPITLLNDSLRSMDVKLDSATLSR